MIKVDLTDQWAKILFSMYAAWSYNIEDDVYKIKPLNRLNC